jgi:hypothetical protein
VHHWHHQGCGGRNWFWVPITTVVDKLGKLMMILKDSIKEGKTQPQFKKIVLMS